MIDDLRYSHCCFLVIFSLLSFTSFSQTISYSVPKKLPARTPEFRILGKNKEGVLVYKYGKSNYDVEAFGNKLNSHWEKSISFKYPEADVKRMVIYPEKTLAFYLSDQKGTDILFAEKWNSKFTGDGSAVAVDTVNSGKLDASSTLRIAPSQNQSKIVCYYPSGQDVAEYLMMTVTDDELHTIAKRKIAINTGGQSLMLRKV